VAGGIFLIAVGILIVAVHAAFARYLAARNERYGMPGLERWGRFVIVVVGLFMAALGVVALAR
jgi:hypothetical protein